jgi:hypothetical protein
LPLLWRGCDRNARQAEAAGPYPKRDRRGIALQQALPFKISPDALCDALRQFGEFGSRGRLHPAEAKRTGGVLGVHPIEKQHGLRKALGDNFWQLIRRTLIWSGRSQRVGWPDLVL